MWCTVEEGNEEGGEEGGVYLSIGEGQGVIATRMGERSPPIRISVYRIPVPLKLLIIEVVLGFSN